MTSTPVTRDLFLAASGKLREATVTVPELGDVVCRELTGEARAKLIETQAASEGLNLIEYQKGLLLGGLVDPGSPEGARTPLLEQADLDAAMQIGAGALDVILEKIEELSGLGVKAKETAEKQLGETPSGSSTSGSSES